MSPETSSTSRGAVTRDSSRPHTSKSTQEATETTPNSESDLNLPDVGDAEAILMDLAQVFSTSAAQSPVTAKQEPDDPTPNLEAKYRALLEQIPAVVFMAYLDRGISEAYVSPQIEAALGYSREEWLEDPVRWYQHIHPEDSNAGVSKPPRCFSPASPCAPHIV